MNDCLNCGRTLDYSEGSVCKDCRRYGADNDPTQWIPMRPTNTNGDKVRAKTNEELSEWFWWMLKYVQGFTDSRVALREWLEQDAAE